MFANTFQSGFISIFYSVGSKPLELWDKQVKNGHIRRIVDDEVRSLVLEVSGTNVATTYITCPIKPRMSLGIKLPFLVMIIKNMKKYFTFEIQILDDKDMHRRFRVSNFQSTTKVRPFCTTMPIGLSSGWNQVQFNLADFTKRAYGSTYLETTRVQIHANVRIRRIYFSDILYSDDELPNEYKLFLPTPGGAPARAVKPEKKESISKDKEKRPSKEEEPPAGALPTPVGPGEEYPGGEVLPTTPEEPPTESEAGPEAPTETEGETTEEGAAATEESPVEGGAAFEGATDEAPLAEGEAGAQPEGGEAPPAEKEFVEGVPAGAEESAAAEPPAEPADAPEVAAEPPAADAAPADAEEPPVAAEEAPVTEEAPPAAEAPAAEDAPAEGPAEAEAAA